jgi:multidrug resistance efflux pump
MRRLILPLLLLAGIFAWLVLRGSRVPDDVYSGTIEARDARVGSQVGGRVAEVLVEEGDSVQAGQVIVRLEADLLEAQVKEQQARVARAKAGLDRVVSGPRREQVERARIEWERAEKERKRQESLLQEALTSDETYEAAAAIAQAAFQAYEELRRGSRSEDEREARAALTEAESRLAYLLRQFAETEVRAPARGVVQTLDLRPGDIVAANQPVASILESGELWVRVYVPETRLGRVKVGQPVEVYIDTYPERPFAAQVASVRDRAEYTPRNVQTVEQREDQVFAVKLEIEPAPELKAGMTATVRLDGAASSPTP